MILSSRKMEYLSIGRSGGKFDDVVFFSQVAL
jgi:hypothetical protein